MGLTVGLCIVVIALVLGSREKRLHERYLLTGMLERAERRFNYMYDSWWAEHDDSPLEELDLL